MKGGRVGSEGRDGAEYVVIGAEGVVHLPTHLSEQWPQGTLVRINVREPQVPEGRGHVGLALGALAALREIDRIMADRA